MKKIYNCPVGNDFLLQITKLIYADDLSGLSDINIAHNTIIYVPSSKIAKALQDKIVKVNNYNSIIMPEIKILGVGDEEADYMAFNFALNSPQAVNKIYREFWLADTIKKFYQKLGDEISMPMALQGAKSIANLFDNIELYEVDLSDIDNMIAQLDLSKHWQINKTFVQYIKPAWDKELEKQGLLNMGAYKVTKLNMLCDYITQQQKTIIMAGFNPYYPALARLMNILANYDKAMVVINGYDNNLTDKQKQNIANDPTHPLSHLQNFIDNNHINIVDFACEKNAFANLFSKALLSAKDTGVWKQSPPAKNAFDNISFVATEDSFEEATAIALMMRHSLEQDDKTTALITADRNLARLVVNNLSRWNIEVDDSSGVPLHLTPPAVFMRLVANVIGENFSPAVMVELFKHPFCYAGNDRGNFSRISRQFEKLILREMVGAVDLNHINDFIDEQVENKYNRSTTIENAPILKRFITDFKNKIKPLLNVDNNITFKQMITNHIIVCENLCDSDILWQGNDGNTLHKIISHILENCGQYQPQNIVDYANSFKGLIMNETVRKTVGLHPRLYIWGLLQGRLQNVDTVIIGGMLEGVMPNQSQVNPFLSNAMNAKIGLPNSDDFVGLTAHDLISCCNGQNIVFTRAKIEGGKQTIPSRWWLRFEAVAKACGFGKLPPPETDYIALAKLIDRAKTNNLQISAPKPTPPINVRPNHLSVTNISLWYNDPYQIYAKYILGLYPLGSLKTEASPNINGNIIHKILENFYSKYTTDIPENAETVLTDMAYEEYAKYSNIIHAESIWLPRFISGLPELVVAIKQAGENVIDCKTETKQEIKITTKNGNKFSYSGTADRIDYLSASAVRIIDYKTGVVPGKTKVINGEEPQLGLIGYALQQQKISIEQLSYWGITNKLKTQHHIDAKNTDITTTAYKKLCQQVDLYADENTPYYNQNAYSRYNDYEHLLRQDEWGVLATSDDSGDNNNE